MAHSPGELEALFELSDDLLAIVGFDGRFQRVNTALASALGYPRQELLSRSMIELTHPDDRQRVRDAVESARDPSSFEARIVRADGTCRRLEWSTRALPARRVVLGLARDTTDRGRADAELEEARRMLEVSRDELRALADEQAALRRVATLVARGAPSDDVFAAVGREAGALLGADAARIVRFVDDDIDQLAGWIAPGYGPLPNGRLPRVDNSVLGKVFHTGRMARIDDYQNNAGPLPAATRALGIQSAVGAPIVIDGRLWGAVLAWLMHPARMPDSAEARLAGFVELVATAVTNSADRAELDRLLAEQAALRRVATLVAQGGSPGAVFDAVTAEVATLLACSAVSLARYDDDVLTIVAAHGHDDYVRVGERFSLHGTNVSSTVLRTGRPSRLEDCTHTTGAIADLARRAGVRSTVAAPVIVDGRSWGVLAASWGDGGAPRADTEARMAKFAGLLDTAIANADSREQLAASRARVVAAGDEARRRLTRDIHDGAQQRLVHTIISLKLARQALAAAPDGAEPLMADALEAAEGAMAEMRELAHGILPVALTRGGLGAGIHNFVSRLDLHVDTEVTGERLPTHIEASAYFIAAEALTNVIKHAQATRATVTAAIGDGVLTLEVSDDGIGGADANGRGLLGIADRVDALGGQLRIESGENGTLMAVRLPLPG